MVTLRAAAQENDSSSGAADHVRVWHGLVTINHVTHIQPIMFHTVQRFAFRFTRTSVSEDKSGCS